ncbi:DISARM system helicase DrmA [Nitrospirillum bahiense]|uniref:Helicase-like protein n=1 Tax=Nitrospirillum amazonense TaxID=28077 RepID=A0A560FVL7_9PROT|nr:DISARM system helicase DrmA [Nitrospirillum amazonense]TWB25632.1 hypothetical protein FBZ88_10929 [Nitrospirillum amazonense]
MTDAATPTQPSAPLPGPQKNAAAVRHDLVEVLRRDLIGPGPTDSDLAREILQVNPSRWYLSGFLAPSLDDRADLAVDPRDDDKAEAQEDEDGPVFGDDLGAGPETGMARAADDAPPDETSARPRRLPASLGLTTLIPDGVTEVEVVLNWGDYRTEPPLPPEVLAPEATGGDRASPDVQWCRVPNEQVLRIAVPEGRGASIPMPSTGGAQRPIGGLFLEAHARPYLIKQPDGSSTPVRALTVMVVNRRSSVRRRYADVAYAFQVRLEVRCATGFYPRCDLSGYGSSDVDAAIADLQFRDVAEYAVGRGVSAGWRTDADGKVRAVFTDHLPQAEVERVEPNEAIADVEFGMEALAEAAKRGAEALTAALRGLPAAYGAWLGEQEDAARSIVGDRRQATARALLTAARDAQARVADGIQLLEDNDRARLAFVAMNEAVSRASRRRNAGRHGDPLAQRAPKWRPFQLAFILLNLRGLAEPDHADREIADLLFFPTGGGKTEAYLGLAAWTIAWRRLSADGVLGAGVSVLMRYTLRLLTLDQLTRAAGVVCALELMRGEPGWQGGGRRLLGDWPIEIGLWVGSAASPNRLGKTGDGRTDTAVARVRRFIRDGREAPAPIKECPWCGAPFERRSFRCVPSDVAPQNMVIGCANTTCDFSRDRPLPILTVDEAIYRRLPAFLIATVDKFAALPWVGQVGAFFGHVDRADDWGFYGAADPGQGKRLWSGNQLEPPNLIIQDELHLISGPLGTVAALYEVALDHLASRQHGGRRIRPKIVASTATVRRAADQVRLLFDRHRTAVFPPPGPDRRNSFFAVTARPDQKPARLYVGLASPGRGPKLIFLRALTTLLAAARAAAEAGGEADAYETAICYFNALRELGGARRIVEDEVTARLRSYGTERRRVSPADAPFADRHLRAPLELTSRVTTDDVASAKDTLALPCADPKGVDVSMATNMISVGLDIGRLGLMLVQGQPKTASEYIQATSRVGRKEERPGLVLVLLNVHKPRDRMHHEQFRHFHACFYRAVEATSVTPWAARALDRALAAVVVAAARHLDPNLTPEKAAARVLNNPALHDQIVEVILNRAPNDAVVGGREALRDLVAGLVRDWAATADNQTGNGGDLFYGYPRDKALLHEPLDPLVSRLSPAAQRFVAGRSMRDVEHASPLKVMDRYGNELR